MSVILSGSAFQYPAGEPLRFLACFCLASIGTKNSHFVEINQAGERSSQTTAELYLRAREILPQLRKHASAGESDIVLCFESVLDFIPAAWACICGGYSWIPWHVSKLSRGRTSAQGCRSSAGSSIILSCSPPTASWEGLLSLEAWPWPTLSVDRDLGQQFDERPPPRGADSR